MLKAIKVLLTFFLFCIFLGITKPILGQPGTIKEDSGYFFSYDNVKLYYQSIGKGFPVILLHGFIVNSNSWKNTVVFQQLINSGYKVILLDMRGNGKSDKPHTEKSYQNDAEAKDVIRLMQRLGFLQYNILAYSRGSIIATRIMANDPSHIHKTVIGGMGTDFMNPNWSRRIMFYHALAFDTIPELHALVKYTEQPGLDRKALSLLQKYQPSTDSATLMHINTPTLVLKGSDDQYSETAEKLASFFPHGKFAIVPGNHDKAVASDLFAQKTIAFFND